MRAVLQTSIECPGCGLVLYNESKKVMSCKNTHCKFHGVKFKRPSVNLRLAGG